MKTPVTLGLMGILLVSASGCMENGSRFKTSKATRRTAGEVTTQNAVFGKDERKKVPNSAAYPFSAVGLVIFGNSACTGTMVGPRHVLTANHCIVWNPDGEAVEGLFVPAYKSGDAPFGYSAVKDVITFKDDLKYTTLDEATGKETSAEWKPEYFAFDMALLVLEDEIGQQTGWLGTSAAKSSMNGKSGFVNVGYPSDRDEGEIQYYSDKCKIEKVESKKLDEDRSSQIRTKCDTYYGHSGGPLYYNSAGWPYVVGVTSGHIQGNKFGWLPGAWNNANYFAAGNGLVEMVAHALAATQDGDIINYYGGSTMPGAPSADPQQQSVESFTTSSNSTTSTSSNSSGNSSSEPTSGAFFSY